LSLVKVTRYYSCWDDYNNVGKVILYDRSSNKLDERVYNNPEEFQVILGRLRNEKPIWFGTHSKHLKTGTLSTDGSVGDQKR